MAKEQFIGYLTRCGFMVVDTDVRRAFGPRYANLLKKLTLVHQMKFGPPKRACVYQYTVVNGIRFIQMPRTLIKTFLGNVMSKLEVLLPPIRTIDPHLRINLYNNQNLIIDHLCDRVFTQERIQSGTATCILNLRAGMGKTYVACGIINRLKLRTLYIVSKVPLMTQAVDDLRDAMYNTSNLITTAVDVDVKDVDVDVKAIPNPITIGKYTAVVKKKDPAVADQDITVIVINSALNCAKEFFAGYSLVIFDEIQDYCTNIRRVIFNKACAHAVLGMSATTEDRSDAFNCIADKELAFDGIIRAENIPGFNYENVAFNCNVKLIRYFGPPEYTKNLEHEATGVLFCDYMYDQFISDQYRLKLIVNEIINLYNWRGPNGEQHCIYVFAEKLEVLRKARDGCIQHLRRDHADIIRDIDTPEDHLEMFTGGLKEEQVTKIKNTGRILFSTYSYAGTGISILKMTSMLFLTPRKANMKQIIARILRRGSDVNIPRIVIDIIDARTALGYQSATRRLTYAMYGFKEVYQRINYDEI